MANLVRSVLVGIGSFFILPAAFCGGVSILQLTPKDIAVDSPMGVRRAVAKTFAESAEDRARAAAALGKMKEKAVSAIPFLIRLLSDCQGGGEDPGHFLVDGCEEYLVRDAACNALINIGAAVIEPLETVASDQSIPAVLRGVAIRVLGKTRDARVLPVLLCLTRDRDIRIRMDSVQALGHLKEKTAAMPLAEIAANSGFDNDLRFAAVVSLGRLRDPRSLPVLIAIAEGSNENPSLRSIAADSLVGWKDPRVSEAFLRLLKGHNKDMREAACLGIAAQGSTEGEEILLQILGDPREEDHLRFMAAQGLTKSENRKGIEKIIELVEKPGRDHVKTSFTELLIRSLAMSGDDRALDRLVLWLSRDELAYEAGVSVLYVRSPRAIDRLVNILRQRKPFAYVCTPERACTALVRIGNPAAIPSLIGIVRDRELHRFSRSVALLALAEFDDPRIMPAVLDSIDDEDSMVQAAAVEILGKKGDLAGIKPLSGLLRKTTDQSLRTKIELALAMIRECQPE